MEGMKRQGEDEEKERGHLFLRRCAGYEAASPGACSPELV